MNTIIGKSDYYKRHGITLRDARNLCALLGLKANRYIMQAADLLVVMKMKY